VKRLMEGAEDQQPLLNFIDAAMHSPDKKAILEASLRNIQRLLHYAVDGARCRIEIIVSFDYVISVF
jgi:hypothetical protein